MLVVAAFLGLSLGFLFGLGALLHVEHGSEMDAAVERRCLLRAGLFFALAIACTIAQRVT